ncbi:7-alpha-hydroxysteroid dehydrogenase [Escherichia albertii]|nr:7-alpha-hydroxysteroid dehydrogenase [Escherichia albertii]
MFNSDNLKLDGKCAIITGAGAGIGKEIAITFATAGASVVVSDINADSANHVVEEIHRHGGQAFAFHCDITSEQELSALADFAVSKLGKVDILVNNAGGGGPKPFDIPMADFRRAYELNVFSFFYLSQLVAPQMEKNGGGVILTITSMAAENKNMTSYASSKAAASHLVRNMAFDLGGKNIRVNGIAPGAILTDALKSVITPEIEQKMLEHTPIRRLGKPQDIADAALFLCSPAASWISGQILTVSGGGVQELN